MPEELRNPLLKGFYPDPSICRVGDDFYMVTSSFSYFPGVPIFHSRDLINWRQIGHVLDRPSQLPLRYHAISGGIYAPTIRYHDGLFYMITTNVSCGGNFIVTAEKPEGPWSEPHWIAGAGGIDPSLFWDDDGRVYYTGTSWSNESGIWLYEIDMKEFRLKSGPTVVWRGALRDCWAPEAPHLYKKDGWYYLMIAEGGTEDYHAVTIARSRSVKGPYKGYEGNPILTHRHLGLDYPISNVGHGDLVQLSDGRWYMVMLASRIYGGYHKNMGRETFIAPVDWSGDWPVVSPGTGKVEWTYPAPLPQDPAFAPAPPSPRQDFASLDFNTLGTPDNAPYRIENGKLRLRYLPHCFTPGRQDETLPGAMAFLGRRQQHMSFRASVRVRAPQTAGASCGLILLQNDFCQLRLELLKEESGVTLRACKASKTERSGRAAEETLAALPCAESAVTLTIAAEGQDIRLLYDGTEIAAANGGFLGSESAGGFVGAYVGPFASGNGRELPGEAVIDWMEYEGKE